MVRPTRVGRECNLEELAASGTAPRHLPPVSTFRWVADRAANLMIVVDTKTDAVVNEVNLAGAVSADPAPDILGLSPRGNRVYATLRGPLPLTGNNPDLNNAQGQTPGLAVIRAEQGGKGGTLKAVFPVSNFDSADNEERADPHGLAVRLR